MKTSCIHFTSLLVIVMWIAFAADSLALDRPNILWITSEDNGCELGCYGDTYATTPNLDALASRSMRYTNAWSNAPVCAPARTAIITGMWPPSLGASHMRSEVRMPRDFQLLPQLLREAGYYCTNNSKEDYNLVKTAEIWNESSKNAHWRKRGLDQPFFAVFNATISHESQIRTRPHKAVHEPAQVRLPGYHPDLPEVRQDWAQYYDRLTEMDSELGKRLKELADDGLTDSTIIVYFGDHGSGMPRGKRWLYQSGLHVPLLISVPSRFRDSVGDRYRHAGTCDDLVSFIDLAPTMLSLCGVKAPEHFDGAAFLGPDARPARQYNYGFRDRMDERYDCSRAVRDAKHLYIRNFMPHRAQGQFLDYMYQTPTTVAWLKAAREGKCNAAQMLFWQAKPAEELYDLQADPDQLKNLADDPALAEVKSRLKGELKLWMVAQRDLGLMPEAIMKLQAGDEPDAATPYEMAQRDFDAALAWDAADQATDLAISLDRVIKLTQSPSAILRYWGNVGLTYRSLKDPAVLTVLEKHVSDESVDIIRAVALEGLARGGSSKQRSKAIQQLVSSLGRNGANIYDKMMIADCLLASNLTEAELPKQLQINYTPNRNTPERYSPYVINTEAALKKIADNPNFATPIGLGY